MAHLATPRDRRTVDRTATPLGGAAGRGSPTVDLEINIVPLVDVLSCLTAFLLVTAVWVNVARIQSRPAGGGPGDCIDGDCERPRLSVLLSTDEIWVGVSRVDGRGTPTGSAAEGQRGSIDDARRIPRTAAGHDWATLEQTLASHKASALFHDRSDIEVAAASRPGHELRYGDLIAAMDLAVRAGFVDVDLTDPQGLSARP